MLKINDMAKAAYENSKAHGFWDGIEDGDQSVVPLKIALIHSEASEALEVFRDGATSHVSMSLYDHDRGGKPIGFDSELADIMIRVGDLAAHLGIDLERAISEKMKYNAGRPRMHPDALFEEGDGQEDDIPFDRPRFGEVFDEDDALVHALELHLHTMPRNATEAQAVMIRSGHDKIELVRARLPGDTDVPILDRLRKSLEGTPVANTDLLAATLRAPVGVVSAMLEEMGWTSDGHGLWVRPE